MANPTKPHFSPDTLRLSERFQKTTGLIGQAATWLVAGSTSPNYLQLNWNSVDADTVDESAWLLFPGNPNAGRLMRNWKTAHLLSMAAVELVMLEQQHPDAHPAVALRTGNLVQVGTHDSLCFGHIGHDRRAIAGREGRGPVEMSAGLYSAEEGQLWVPGSLANSGVRLPIVEFELPALSTIRVV